MKTLQVYPYYPPAKGFGGVTPVVETIATRLAERGHESTVYTTDTGGFSGRIDITSSPVIRDNVTVHYFRNLSNQLAYRVPLPIPLGYWKTVNTRVTEFDAVHIHGYPHLLAVLTVWAAQKESVPYVLSPHGSVNLPEGVSERWLRKIFERTIGESILSDADTVIALTEDEERRLREEIPSIQNIEIIPNGIDPDQVQVPQSEVQEFRERYGFEESLLVMFVGRLTYKKGLDVLWQTAEKLDGEVFEGQSVEFGIAGPDDGMRDKFEDYISENDIGNVSILGYLPEQEKNAALAASDVFVLPSYSEGQPISVLEACSVGTPAVVSRQCSIPEIDEYNAGRVIDPTPSMLETALRELLVDSEERDRCARNARRMIAEEFSWEHVVDDLIALYQSL